MSSNLSPARALMFQGTGSDVGKSLIVAGLCRAFAARGLRVRPFKPQNMSNNAAVTAEGGEIGRAQALQARACGVAPSVHMNPVLLKPQSDIGAQIVVQGRVLGAAQARDYYDLTPRLLRAVLDSFARIKGEADLVLIEGAGSAAEVNLRERDIANMGFARVAETPVVLIGDIDRGGVIAQLVGTKAVIAPEDAELIVGFLVNKFRGDASLFDDGMRFIAERTGWRALGLIPFFAPAHRLPPEDAVVLDGARDDKRAGLTIAVPMLSRIANFDDFDPLRLEPGRAARHGAAGRAAAARRSRHSPRHKGDDRRPRLLSRAGLGHRSLRPCQARRARARRLRRLSDARAHGRRPGRRRGTGRRGARARAARCRDDDDGRKGAALRFRRRASPTALPSPAMKCTSGARAGRIAARPLLRFADGREDGAISPDGRVMGAYVHALFADDAQRAAWLAMLGASSELVYEATVERTLDELAAHLARHIDLDALLGAGAVRRRRAL